MFQKIFSQKIEKKTNKKLKKKYIMRANIPQNKIGWESFLKKYLRTYTTIRFTIKIFKKTAIFSYDEQH